MIFRWNPEKNEQLIRDRGVSFEEVVLELSTHPPLAVRRHPNTEKYPHQSIYIIELRGYIYMIPFVDMDDERFLKTIIPSRKLKKEFH